MVQEDQMKPQELLKARFAATTNIIIDNWDTRNKPKHLQMLNTTFNKENGE